PTGLGHVQLRVRNLDSGEETDLLARRVVLATGRDGLGGPWVPEWAHELPRERWMHSADFWDDNVFKGKRVVVIRVGASAMDSAATALENGAARVHLLARRPYIPRINKSKGSVSPGMTHGFWKLPDEWRWRIRHYINAQQVPPPQGSTLRVSQHANAFFQPKRPDSSDYAHTNRLRVDRLPPANDEVDTELHDSPDLGPSFEFRPKQRLTLPGLERVHCFCYPSTLSHGKVAGDIPQISDGAERLARNLCALFLEEDMSYHFEALQAYAEPELNGDEWKETPIGEIPTAAHGI